MGTRGIGFAVLALAMGAFVISPRAGSAAVAFDAAAGKQVFTDNCTACHSATTTQRIAGPGLKGLYKNSKLPASGKPVTDANVRKQILKGGGGMPGFEGSLTDVQIDDLIAYLKTL